MGVINIVLIVVYGVCVLVSFIANVITFKRVGGFRVSFSQLIGSIRETFINMSKFDNVPESIEPVDENDSYYIDKFAALAEMLQGTGKLTWKRLAEHISELREKD